MREVNSQGYTTNDITVRKAEADAAGLSTSGNVIFPNPRHTKSGSTMSRGSKASADPSIQTRTDMSNTTVSAQP